MNVLVIPEDFRKDRFMLEPIVQAMMTALGKPRAKVEICRDPLLGGVNEALKAENIHRIITKYAYKMDLFLLCVDRDGEAGRKTRLRQLEEQANAELTGGKAFLAENAWQEIEVWVLAGHDDLPREWDWKAVRQEVDPKERYFAPDVRQRGLSDAPGDGRRALGLEAAARYARVRQLCPEDIGSMHQRVQAWLDDNAMN